MTIFNSNKPPASSSERQGITTDSENNSSLLSGIKDSKKPTISTRGGFPKSLKAPPQSGHGLYSLKTTQLHGSALPFSSPLQNSANNTKTKEESLPFPSALQHSAGAILKENVTPPQSTTLPAKEPAINADDSPNMPPLLMADSIDFTLKPAQESQKNKNAQSQATVNLMLKLANASINNSRSVNKSTVLSGHGSYSPKNGTFTLPKNTSFTVYAFPGNVINDSLGNLIELRQKEALQNPAIYTKTYHAGDKIKNYTLHPPEHLKIMGNPILVSQDTPISELIKEGGGDFHFAACLQVIGKPAPFAFGTKGVGFN